MKERKVRIPTALMLMVLAVVGTFNITYFTATEYYNRLLEDLQTQETRYKKLKEVTDIVDKYYVGDYEEADALELAAAGYVAGLGDVWSGYYTAEQTASIREEESNQYVGIGVSYGIQEDNLYEITAVTPGGPADKAGMLPGDRLLTADGVDVNTLESPDDLGALVKGEVGTLVTITVDRAGEELTFQITRDTILVYSVTSQLLEGSVGYIAISDFNSNVEKEFRSHMESLTAQGAKAFVFDVRNNPGGYVSVMHDMLDSLLPEGPVITMVDKAGTEMPLTSDKACLEVPMAVITNAYSISAAEFFAAALQEYGMATVVGEKTGGKGYSQQTFMLSDGSSVNLSTTRYYTPKGNSLAETGVTPDQTVELSVEDLSLLLSGKLEPAEDEQLQAALQTVVSKIPAEEAPTEAPTAE
ncbi:MAG: S41 family peptidase [Clostridia bacterium]|nr:S41 family peptidase [Clostridia bacterium]MBR6575250.1 S41 family peptidase [Clostridia bacterium]